MLADANAMATIAVKDLGIAKTFYGEKLGFELLPQGGPGVANFKSGSSTVVVYESEFAGTNQATSCDVAGR